MPASGSHIPTRLLQSTLPLAALLGLAACGGGSINGTSGGGGSNAVLAGTYYAKSNTSTRGSDHVFGAVNALGNGYFADLGGSSRAVFVFGSASDEGAISGTFAAYAANGSNLGDSNDSTLQNGSISGTVASESGTTSATITYANTAAGFSNSATLALDAPALAVTPLATAAGTYAASLGTTAIASGKLVNLAGSSYSLSLTVAGAATLSTVSSCGNFTGTATLDSSYDIYDLHLTGNCSGATVTLDGQATDLAAGSASPLDGSTLTTASLVVELSDFLVNGDQYALVMIAPLSS